MEADKVFWADITGLHDVDLIHRIGQKFNIHQLQLEDILNTVQRPKAEVADDSVFLTFRMLTKDDGELQEEQISLFLGNDVLLSFQEKPGDVFDPIRERLDKAAGRIRTRKADYLLYALLDVTVDSYFHILESIGSRQEELEDMMLEDPDKTILLEIRKCKNDLYTLRKAIFPLREAVSKIMRGDGNLIHENTNPYFEDVHDHLIQLAELVENYREINTDLREIYLSTLSMKMNEIMKVLTIISTIFIPLSFVAGVYGTNFDILPELHWQNGYLFFWLICLTVAGAMIYYFKKKNWY
jgi:magnesium transporter